MPESHLGWRGHFVSKAGEEKAVTQARKQIWIENQNYLNEWKKLYRSLNTEEQKQFIRYINDNAFTLERFETIEDPVQRKLFLHYFTMPALLKVLASDNTQTILDVVNYITIEFPLIYSRMIQYISGVKTQYSILEGPYKIFGKKLVSDVLKSIDVFSDESRNVIANLRKIQLKLRVNHFDFNLIQYAKLYYQAKVFKKADIKTIIGLVHNLDEKELRTILIDRLPAFEKKIKKIAAQEVGSEYIIEEIKGSLTQLGEQLSFFGDEDDT